MKKKPQFTIFGHFDSTQLEIMISNQPKSDHNEGHLVKHKRKDHKPKDLTIDLDAEAEKDCCDSCWFCNCFLHCCCNMLLETKEVE